MTIQFNPATNEYEMVDGVTFNEVTITDPERGIIISSPTYQWRLTVSDAGALVITQIILS